MLSSSSPSPPIHGSLSPPFPGKISNSKISAGVSVSRRPTSLISSPSPASSLRAAIPLSASIAILLWTTPVNAGFLSGFSGLESVPAPQLPDIDFLKKWNGWFLSIHVYVLRFHLRFSVIGADLGALIIEDENQKKYAEFDSRFRSSTVLKELLEKSKLNKERNRKEIQDKYCLRGAEWGVGDCSTQGMTDEERNAFIETLKKNIK
ncbi:hypothetical protein AXF42_Ash004299 [Apostasia shenzhenica]|uniref:Uncharacterized protein n=1 Tax=Apostasia shenzhenica TaxID=1088818 RepID=A0A2I0A2I7_9ASPA|nr:hypothetical protein AXF42_Ash004299 [Apostasia shenzhenica]